MTHKIPLASNIVAGLMSQDDKIKLDAMPGSITGSVPSNFSASNIQTHQFSSSYFSMSSGSFNNASASTLTVYNLIAQNSNLTGTAVIPDPLSSSVQRSNEFSSSYFSMSSGSFNNASASILTVYNLIAQNSNITSSIPDPLSSSVQRSNEFSTSYFSMSSGSFNNASASILKVFDLIVQNSNLTSSVPDPLSSSYHEVHNLVASYLYLVNSFITFMSATHLSATHGEIGSLVTLLLSSSISRTHQFSGSYLSASSFQLGNGGYTQEGGAILADRLSSVYYGVNGIFTIDTANGTTFAGGFVDGIGQLTGTDANILRIESTEMTSTYLSSSIQKVDQFSASYYNIERIVQIQVTDPNGSAITTGDGKAYFTIPQEFNGYKITKAHASLVTGSTSGTPTFQVRNATTTSDVLSTAITIDIGDNPPTSYTAATPPVVNNSNNQVSTGQSVAIDIDIAGTGAKGLSVILTLQSP